MDFVVNDGYCKLSVPIYYIFAELNAVKQEKITGNVEGEVLDVPIKDLVEAVKYFNITSLIEIFASKGLLSDYGFSFKTGDLRVLTRTRELGAIICIQKSTSDDKKTTIIIDIEETISGPSVKRIILNGIRLPINASIFTKTINQLIIENC